MKKYSVRPALSDDILKSYAPYSALTAKILHARAVLPAQAKDFLEPDYDNHRHDPFLLKDMDKAVERILKALKDNEKIAIWSDYDADGMPGAIIFRDFFKRIGFTNFFHYIPHRHDEGFGLNIEGLKDCLKEGAGLVITIDCGITDLHEADTAFTLGLDLIITDHHIPSSSGLPKVLAVIDPKRADCPYPFKELCGATLAFKLVEACVLSLSSDSFGSTTAYRLPPNDFLKWSLDMVGLATLSDMVPLIGENRVFAKYGLQVLRKSPRLGLSALFKKLYLNRNNLNEDDITFMITPRINAASRMGAHEEAFNLLRANEESEALQLADRLNKINDERKGMSAHLVKEVKKVIAERYMGRPKVIVAGDPSWRPGILGLVAGIIADEHTCPVFLWGRNGDGKLKGSCRGGGFNVSEIMAKMPEGIFLDRGGHKASGGFTLSDDHIHSLREALENVCASLDSDLSISNNIADAHLSLNEVSEELFSELNRLSPFGVGNPKPIFILEGLRIFNMRMFGKTGDHLELRFKKESGGFIKAVAFFANKLKLPEISIGEDINIVASLEKSFFGGRTELRLRLLDLWR